MPSAHKSAHQTELEKLRRRVRNMEKIGATPTEELQEILANPDSVSWQKLRAINSSTGKNSYYNKFVVEEETGLSTGKEAIQNRRKEITQERKSVATELGFETIGEVNEYAGTRNWYQYGNEERNESYQVQIENSLSAEAQSLKEYREWQQESDSRARAYMLMYNDVRYAIRDQEYASAREIDYGFPDVNSARDELVNQADFGSMVWVDAYYQYVFNPDTDNPEILDEWRNIVSNWERDFDVVLVDHGGGDLEWVGNEERPSGLTAKWTVDDSYLEHPVEYDERSEPEPQSEQAQQTWAEPDSYEEEPEYAEPDNFVEEPEYAQPETYTPTEADEYEEPDTFQPDVDEFFEQPTIPDLPFDITFEQAQREADNLNFVSVDDYIEFLRLATPEQREELYSKSAQDNNNLYTDNSTDYNRINFNEMLEDRLSDIMQGFPTPGRQRMNNIFKTYIGQYGYDNFMFAMQSAPDSIIALLDELSGYGGPGSGDEFAAGYKALANYLCSFLSGEDVINERMEIDRIAEQMSGMLDYYVDFGEQDDYYE